MREHWVIGHESARVYVLVCVSITSVLVYSAVVLLLHWFNYPSLKP